MVKLLAPLTALGLFATLAAYAYGKHVTREWHHVTMSEGEFVAQKLEEYHPVDAVAKGKTRYDYPWACDDTNKKCLTLLADTPKQAFKKCNKVSDVNHAATKRRKKA
jgi:hypothetical protein